MRKMIAAFAAAAAVAIPASLHSNDLSMVNRIMSRCYVGSAEACYFRADLSRADLNKGIQLTVVDDRDGRAVIPTRLVTFTRTVSYSLARWDAMMTV